MTVMLGLAAVLLSIFLYLHAGSVLSEGLQSWSWLQAI